MKKENLKASFDRIGPSEADEKRMLNEILNRSEQRRGIHMTAFNIKKAVPALALAVVIAGGVFTFNLINNGKGNEKIPEYATGEDSIGRGDMAMPLLNEFQIDGRHYILLADELRAEYGFPSTISENDIGSKITAITKSPDSSLIGKEVYQYLPADGEAVVAVKKDNEYLLHKFFYFESYANNKDEDAADYLKVYGINKADDIAKIKFIGHSEQSKLEGRTDIIGEITDRSEIGKFYDYYSVLKNSSDKYFDKLFGFKGYDNGETPPGAAVSPDGTVSSGKGTTSVTVTYPIPPEPNTSTINNLAPDYIAPIGTPSPAYTEPAAPDAAGSHGATDSIASNSTASDNIASDSITYETIPVDPVSPGQAGTAGQGSAAVTGQGSTEPSRGTAGNALADSVTIRIYTQSGVYYDTEYYISFGFLSRFEVNAEFADFMSAYIK